MRYLQLALGCSLICGFWNVLLAQPTSDIEVLFGGMFYQGDLQSNRLPDLQDIGPTIGLRSSHYLHPDWAIQASFLTGSFTADDRRSGTPSIFDRGFKTETRLYELAAKLRWEPFASRRYPASGGMRRILSPYAYAGVGTYVRQTDPTFNQPTGDGLEEAIQIDRDASYTRLKANIMLGGGIRVDISDNSSLGLEGGLRPAFSDYLDGISQSANPAEPDWYGFALLTYSRRFHLPDQDHDGIMDEEDRCPEDPGLDALAGCPDADLDGVADLDDRCPYQIGPPDLEGCPDLDLDGVADLFDDCKARPGSPSADGCPDLDGDGLRDWEDACPECPGKKTNQGCPDTDLDGILDPFDRCPTVVGTVPFEGCPFLDSDWDGVPDSIDVCPQLAGTRLNEGCPDSDGDGVADNADSCPGEVGTPDNQGCPPLPDTVKTVLKLATTSIQFETGSAKLKSPSLLTLERLRNILVEFDYYHMRIAGHTDSQGNDARNLALSEARAKACYEYLREHGIDSERLLYVGYGERQPIATNKTASGRSKNRRVAFDLYFPVD